MLRSPVLEQTLEQEMHRVLVSLRDLQVLQDLCARTRSQRPMYVYIVPTVSQHRSRSAVIVMPPCQSCWEQSQDHSGSAGGLFPGELMEETMWHENEVRSSCPGGGKA